MSCPKCGHSKFYLNDQKRVGYCHRASCRWSPGPREILQHFPHLALLPATTEPHREEHSEISLPEGSQPIFNLDGSISAEDVVQRVEKDRRVPREVQRQADIHHTDGRVVLPVYSEGKLVAYVARSKWWLQVQPSMRYKYPSGASMGSYLYNWQQAQYLERLTLVENSFNALWIRGAAVFGSRLTQRQQRLIQCSKARSVAVLFDRGAESAAEEAVEALQRGGVPAAYARLQGQPDDLSDYEVSQVIGEVHKAALEGRICAV